jgi:hypothetical protein
MATPAVAPVKLTPWQKVVKFFKGVDAVSENLEVEAIQPNSLISEYLPGVKKILGNILTAQSNLRVALSQMPSGLSKAEEADFVVRTIAGQTITDAALLGKQLSTDNVTLLNNLISQAHDVIINAPDLTTPPTAAAIAAAEGTSEPAASTGAA